MRPRAPKPQETVLLQSRPVGSIPDHMQAVNALDSLTPTERQVASLGIDPDALKPIEFLNVGHYKELREKQLLSDAFRSKIEAYSELAAEEQ